MNPVVTNGGAGELVYVKRTEHERLKLDAERYAWLRQYLVVAAEAPGDWTCWLALECIPYRSKESDAQTLLDEMMERFPLTDIRTDSALAKKE